MARGPLAFSALLRGPIVAVLLALAINPWPVQAADAEPMLDIETLAGVHPCKGRNPDGGEYEGTLTIRTKGELLLFQWDIAGQKTYGTGLCEGMSVGVALDAGVVIYQVFPQAEGKTLVGLWAQQGAEKATEEIITIGHPDISTFPPIRVEPFNGSYNLILPTTTKDTASDIPVTITGDDIIKRAKLGQNPKNPEAEGLALGSGLSLITPTGLIVLTQDKDAQGGDILTGRSLNQAGQVINVSLVPKR